MEFTQSNIFKIVLIGVFGFLIVLGLVLFARYGGSNTTSTKIGKVTIWGTLPEQNMESVLSPLRSQNSDYLTVSYVQKSEATFNTDLAEAIATGNSPDLLLISQEELVTIQNKLSVVPFSTLSQRTFINSYLPIDEIYLASNGTYGIPFTVDPFVMYYNRATLTNAGAATPPTSWEAVTSLSEQLSRSSAGTISQSTVPFGVYDNVENARAILSLLLLQSGNPIVTVSDAGPHAHLTDAGTNSAVSPAQSALSFYTQFSDPAKTVYSWNRAMASAHGAFIAGTLAFYPGFASELPDLKQANPNLDFDMIAIPQPQTASERVTFGKAYAFAVPKASPNAAGAVSVGFALASPSLAQTVASALHMAPATRASLMPAANDLYQPVYFPQALIAKAWLSPSPATTDQIFSTMINNITSGKMSEVQAISTANQALDASI